MGEVETAGGTALGIEAGLGSGVAGEAGIGTAPSFFTLPNVGFFGLAPVSGVDFSEARGGGRDGVDVGALPLSNSRFSCPGDLGMR